MALVDVEGELYDERIRPGEEGVWPFLRALQAVVCGNTFAEELHHHAPRGPGVVNLPSVQ